mmetsp:Transcript_7870/g.8856  ORF Transcript_7870/g.8856 Transcript_7870/m.8856 type:complete len:275 (-) Transcript_7870:710-1534(-)
MGSAAFGGRGLNSHILRQKCFIFQLSINLVNAFKFIQYHRNFLFLALSLLDVHLAHLNNLHNSLQHILSWVHIIEVEFNCTIKFLQLLKHTNSPAVGFIQEKLVFSETLVSCSQFLVKRYDILSVASTAMDLGLLLRNDIFCEIVDFVLQLFANLSCSVDFSLVISNREQQVTVCLLSIHESVHDLSGIRKSCGSFDLLESLFNCLVLSHFTFHFPLQKQRNKFMHHVKLSPFLLVVISSFIDSVISDVLSSLDSILSFLFSLLSLFYSMLKYH